MHTIPKDLRQADETAVRLSVALVRRVTAADLSRPTPCAAWDLTALLTHMTVQHRGFAAAAEGRGREAGVWQPSPGDETRYEAAADALLAAFAAPDVPERPFALPEISPDRDVPGALAIGFHLVDYVVHGWDVAAALGIAYDPPADLLAAALPIARAVPEGPSRTTAGAAFAPARPVPSGAGPLAEILLRLGRDPDWPAGG
jgi:uncharacterized protein (TIGR03086 family)